LFVTVLSLTMLVVVTPALAGGHKNRGDVGQGAVEQHQVNWDGYAGQNQEQPKEQVQARLPAG